MQQVYLDNAATTQMRDDVVTVVTKAMSTYYGNASSSYHLGRTAKALIETSRKTVAKLLNVSSGEIVFTSGGTEANNLVLRSAVRDLGITHVITTRIEHHAVLHTLQELEKEYAITVTYLELDAYGQIAVSELEALLANQSHVLVSLMHVNNEIGNILDLKSIGTLCSNYKALFHTDAVQSVGHTAIDLQELPVDFLTASAHKFHGPKGIGFAFIRKPIHLKPLLYGGEQEKGIRAGTEATHNIAGLEKAIEMAYAGLTEELKTLKALKLYFITQLETKIEGVMFNGLSKDMERSAATIVNVRFPVTVTKTAMFLFQLDLKGIACSRGSACQSGSSKKSHVLSEILDAKANELLSIRFSFSIFNTKEDIDYTIAVLKALL